MALQFRRGTESERDQPGFVPLIGEPIYTTDTKRLYIGDGAAAGGNPIGFNNNLSDLSDIELGYEQIIPILTIAASSGEVTITTLEPHGLSTGDEVYLDSRQKPALNGIRQITAIGITTLSFEFNTLDFDAVNDDGALKFEPKDNSILAWDQATAKWTEQTFVYRFRDLGDVQLTDPIQNDIIQYTDIPIGNIVDEDSNVIETGVEEPSTLPEGLSWVETGFISKFTNKQFEIGLGNLTDVLINPNTLADKQILAYDSFIEYWRPTSYVDELTDLDDVEITELPDPSQTQARVTILDLWNELDSLSVSIAGTTYTYALTEADIDTAFNTAITNDEFNDLIRAAVGNQIKDLINADPDAPVTATFANNIIGLNPKSTPVNLNLVATVYNNSEDDSRTPAVSVFEPINSQILAYDGEKWTNKTFEINNFELNTLNDVNLDNVQNNQIIQYNESLQKWTNVPNFISLNQFADVEIVAPTTGQALVYDEQTETFKAESFILNDLLDVNDPSADFFVPDGSILAWSEADQIWKPQQFSSLSTRTEVTFDTGPLENLEITIVNFEAFTGYAVFKAQASALCTLTLYVSQYEREIDIERAEDEPFQAGSGIFAEFTFPDTTYRRVAPVIYGFNDDSPIRRRAYAKVRNRSGYYQDNIQLKLTILQIEEDPEQIFELQ